MLYRNIIFDLYGTLVDIRTNEDKPSLWNKLALFYGYYGAHYEPEELHQAYLATISRLESEHFAQIKASESTLAHADDVHEAHPEIKIEQVFSALYNDKGISADEVLAIHTGQFFRVLSTERLCLYPHAAELLLALRAAGANVYLLSNAQRIFTEYEMHLLGIADYFDEIFISSECGTKKPDSRFFHILLDKYEINPSKAIMIGNDGTSDIAGAKAVGLHTLYIRSGISPKEELPSADYVLKKMNLRQVEKILIG